MPSRAAATATARDSKPTSAFRPRLANPISVPNTDAGHHERLHAFRVRLIAQSTVPWLDAAVSASASKAASAP